MKNALILIVIILIIVGGFFLFKTFNGTTNPLPMGKTIEVTLSSQGESGEDGTAVLTDMDGKLKVTLKLTGAPVGIAQPAHIHTGSCDNLGSPRYTLTDVSGGTSETELMGVSVDQLLGELPLAINVHKSAQEASVYVACGNIVASSTTTPEMVATTTAGTVATSTVSTTTPSATSTATSTKEL